jgi:hypothetical protein
MFFNNSALRSITGTILTIQAFLTAKFNQIDYTSNLRQLIIQFKLALRH